MRYTVNYCGAFFVTDSDDFNCRGYSRYEDAYNLLRDIIECKVDEYAYLKDEECQCSLYWDKETKEFYWN